MTRHYQPLADTGCLAFGDYPMYDFRADAKKRRATWRAGGDPRCAAELRVIPQDPTMDPLTVTVTTRAGDVAEVLLRPEADYERRTVAGGMGCEDPRVTFVPRLDAYVMAYTAFGPHGPRIALAISTDAYAWKRLGLVQFADEPLNHVPNKDAAFFPEPVLSPSGVLSFALYHRPMLRESFNGQAPIGLILSLLPEQRE